MIIKFKKQRGWIALVNRLYAHVIGICQGLIYSFKYRKLLRIADKKDYKPSKEELHAYKKRWSGMGYRVDTIYYRLFSNYVTPDVDFVPEDISHNVIEPLLNPPLFRGFCGDKNMFDRIMADIPGICPKTLFRRIGGFYYNASYQSLANVTDNILLTSIQNYDRVIVKPTVDSSSGLGIHFFESVDNLWKDVSNGQLLTLAYLEKELGTDYIIQEVLHQSTFMSRFNPTSVNTLRIFTYRSVKDNRVHVLNAIMRIGGKDALVDNAHQGGAVIGVDINNGKLNHFMVDQMAKRFTVFNGIDFESDTFVIPEWAEVKDLAVRVGEANIYHRCLNMDIMIDAEHRPRLLEYNLTQMSVWLFQLNNGSCYGPFTDEVIAYCREHKKDVKSEYLQL